MDETSFRLSRRQFGACLAAGVAATGTAFAQADDYPSRPIRLIVPLAAGGGTDVLARATAKEMEKTLGTNIIVENRPGASGAIGAKYVSQAKPDGYTLVIGTQGSHLVNEYLFSDLQYKPREDFAPITLLGIFNNLLVVPASSKYQTLAQLVAEAKAKPDTVTFAIAAQGSSPHLAMEDFMERNKVRFRMIPYQSISSAQMDLLGGRVDFMADAILNHHANILAGKSRGLATMGRQRSPMLPDVPTISESGYPDFSAVGWLGLYAPRGTPMPVRQKLAAAVKQAHKHAELHQVLKGVELVSGTPEEFERFITTENDKWSRVIRNASITVK